MADEFDPSKPFETEEFDPSKPFETADDSPPLRGNPPVDLMADQGPPAPSGANLQPPDRRSDLLSKARALGLGAGEGATFGHAAELAGGLGTVYEKIAGFLGGDVPKRDWGDAYREKRDTAQQMHDESRADNPWLYGLAQAGGGLGVTPLIPGGVAASGKAAIAQGAGLGALAGLGGSKADLTKGELGDAAIDTGVGAAVGGALGWAVPKIADKAAAALKNPIAQAKEKLGDLAQVPQRLYEGAAERIGRTGIAQKSSAASDVPGALASVRVKALRQIRDNADLGSELASTLRKTSEALGGTGNKLITQMNQQERAQVAQGMAELLKTRGLGDVTPEFVTNNMDDLARAAGLDLENLTGNTFLRMANKRDPGWWVSAGEGVRRFWGNKLLAGETIDPRLAEQYGLNRDVADAMKMGAVDRMGRPMAEGGARVVYQNPLASIHGKLSQSEQQAAVGRVAAEDVARRARVDMPTTPGVKLGDIRGAAAPEEAQTVEDFMRSVNDNVRARGTNPADAGVRVPGFEADSGATMSALRGLQDVSTGRKFLEERALPILGAAVGGALGKVGSGVLGAVTGASLGAGSASKLPVVADAFSEIGQAMSQSGRDAIRKSALRAAGDPAKIRSLAGLPGAVGDAARRAVDASKDPSSFAARSYVLTLMPEFRALLADDESRREAR